MQDLIDSDRLSVSGVNDQGNKSVAPPNQNLQIFIDPIPKHNISFVKSSKTTKNYVMNVDTDDDNIEQAPMETSPMDTIGKGLIALIETQPRKG